MREWSFGIDRLRTLVALVEPHHGRMTPVLDLRDHVERPLVFELSKNLAVLPPGLCAAREVVISL
jgi:hypothetical protein